MPSGKYPEVITYWGTGASGEYGVANLAAPTLLRGRWEDRAELLRNPKGDEFVSAAVVFCSGEVWPDGYLARGDHSLDSTPGVGAMEIKQVTKVRNVRYTDQEIRAYL